MFARTGVRKPVIDMRDSARLESGHFPQRDTALVLAALRAPPAGGAICKL